MDGFTGILFHVDTLDTHEPRRPIAHFHQHLTFAHDRVVKLRDLIALRQVGVEIVLAVKSGIQVDPRLETQPRAHRLFYTEFIDHGQHAGHGCINKSHIRVRLGPECCGGP